MAVLKHQNEMHKVNASRPSYVTDHSQVSACMLLDGSRRYLLKGFLHIKLSGYFNFGS
jgi:hypothetical protein